MENTLNWVFGDKLKDEKKAKWEEWGKYSGRGNSMCKESKAGVKDVTLSEEWKRPVCLEFN